MPNDLADVLHYLLPDGPDGPDASAARRTPRGRLSRRTLHEPTRIAALPLVCVPVGPQDVVRAAFVWNLAVEVVRLGGHAAVVAPTPDDSLALWPAHGEDALGTNIVLTPSRDLEALYRDALDVAVERAIDATDGGVVFVRVPPAWLRDTVGAGSLLRWSLLFTSSDRRDLQETYALAKLLARSPARAQRIGVTVHGARAVAEARAAFERLAGTASRHLRQPLTSYGLLVDDLDVYRAIVAKRPIGLAHPQSAAARSLSDVAKLVLQDARSTAAA